MPRIGFAFCISLLTILTACSQSGQDRANRDGAEAKAKARDAAARLNADAKKLGHEVKEEARVFDRKVDHAINSNGTSAGGTSGAEAKFAEGGRELHAETAKAGVKLDRAALIAKVRAKLAL